MWIGKVLLIVFIFLETGISQQSKEAQIDVEQFLKNIKITIEKVIKSSRKRGISNKKKRDKVRKQLLKKLTYPHLSLFKHPSHYTLNYNPPSQHKSDSTVNNPSNLPPFNKVLNSMTFEDKVRTMLKDNPSVFSDGLSEFKKMFERIKQKIRSNISPTLVSHKDNGKQQNVSYGNQYLDEVKYFMLEVLKTLGSYWYNIKIMLIDNASFYEKWKKRLCPCINSIIFTPYYWEFVFKENIEPYSYYIHIPLDYTNISEGCSHTMCFALKKLAQLTADKKFSQYLSKVNSCIVAGDIRKRVCATINVNMYQLYQRAISIFNKFDKILKEIILPSYISLLTSPTVKEAEPETVVSVLGTLRFYMIKESLNRILNFFITLQQMLQKDGESLPAAIIINKYNCRKEAQEFLTAPFNKFMVDYSALVIKMKSSLSTLLYELNITLKNDYIEYSYISGPSGFTRKAGIISLMSEAAKKKPEKLYEILFSKEFEKVIDKTHLEELFNVMQKGVIEKKSLCMLIAWGILLGNISIQDHFYQRSKELLSPYGFFDTSLVLGSSYENLLRAYFEKYYKEQKLLDVLVDIVKKIRNDEESIRYLSYLLSPPPPHKGPDATQLPPEKIAQNHIIFIAHFNYIIYSIFSALRTYKCLGIDDGKEYDTFIGQYRCLLEGKNIDCLGGGFTYLTSMLKSVPGNKGEINLSNYSEFSKRLGEVEIKNVGFVKSNCPGGASVCKIMNTKEIGEENKKNFCSAIIDMDIYSGIIESCGIPFSECPDRQCGGSNKPILCYYKTGSFYSLGTNKCCLECKESSIGVDETCDCSAYINPTGRQECERCVAAGTTLAPVFNIYRRMDEYKNNIPRFCSIIKEDMSLRCCIPTICISSSLFDTQTADYLKKTDNVIVERDIFSDMKKHPNLLDYEKTIQCLHPTR